jgi:hypothetical protein
MRAANAGSRIEEVGAELRSHMAFINPRRAPDGWADDARAGAAPEPAR